jgi:hypothetical protein
VVERLDERLLEDVLRDVRAAGHPHRVPVQRVAVAVDEDANASRSPASTLVMIC